MKKRLSIIVLAAMILGMPVHVSASGNEITQDSDEKSGKISIDYNGEENYTVTIPASVTFTDAEKEVERGLQVADVMLNEGSSLHVTVTSQNGFKMKKNDGYIDYELRVNYNKTPNTSTYEILTVSAGEGAGIAILTFITELDKSHALYTGNFTDTLTFTVSVD